MEPSAPNTDEASSLPESVLERSFSEVQGVQWGNVAPLLEETNPTLHERMEQVAREEGSSELYLASYPYGDSIVEDGIFKAPCDHFHSEKKAGMCSCDRMWEAVNYPIPLTVVLSGAVEVFDVTTFVASGEVEDHVVPLRLLGRGAVFGDFESLDDINYDGQLPPPSWSVSAGGRSVYLQLRTGSSRFWTTLGEQLESRGAEGLPLSLDDLREQSDHALVRFIVRHHPDLLDWSSQLLIIPTNWFKGSSVEKQRLRHLLYKRAWVKSRHLRYELSRTASHFEYVKDHSKYTPFLRYLLFATRGDLPVFRPSTLESNSSRGPSLGPFFEVQEFLDSVADKVSPRYVEYYPAILSPSYLDREGSVGYCSFRIPTFENPIPEVDNFSAEYARPTAKFFSPASPKKKEERMSQFSVEDVRVFHSAKNSRGILKKKSAIKECYIDEFIPKHKSGKTLQLHDGSFLSTSVRVVRS